MAIMTVEKELPKTEQQPASDIEVGQLDSAGYQEQGWERGLSPRAVIMLSLGGGIGFGLWIGTGTALSSGMHLITAQDILTEQPVLLDVPLDIP